MHQQELTEALAGEVLEDEADLSLGDLCRACGVQADWVMALVEEGVLEPHGGDAAQWRFPGGCLRRVRVAGRLQRDLGLNPPGAALALELMDEIRRLRERHGL